MSKAARAVFISLPRFNLLNLLDYSKLDVDLLLFKKEGLFINQVPSEVNILNIPISLKYSYSPLDGDALKSFSAVKAGANRVIGTIEEVEKIASEKKSA